MTIALFPGQGAQSSDMGRGLVDVSPEVFGAASDALGVDVAELCIEGKTGSADLASTRWAQPAVVVCSVAAFRALAGKIGSWVAAAGHSIGEYAALVATDTLDLPDALRLVGERAEATDEAGRTTPSGMAAVMRIEQDAVARICEEHGVALAADNGPGQFVVSGPDESLTAALEALDAAGAKCRRLDVSAAFHSQVMAPAADRLRSALDQTTFSAPRFEFWSTTTAGPLREPEEIRAALLDQLTAPVRWRETVDGLAKRIGKAFCDLGPGRVVAGLTKRIVEGADIRTTQDLLAPATGGST